jgi:hypothetical protein
MLKKYLILSLFMTATGLSMASEPAMAADDDPFVVVKVIPGCNYFIAETPSWYAVAEDYLCSMPGEGDQGSGNLITYFATDVQLNGSSCTLWVETWGGESTVVQRLKEKCDL